MKAAVITLKSTSPYSQSKHYEVPHNEGESHPDYEIRTWRERMHVTRDGHVMIPPEAFTNCIKISAQRLAIPIPGDKRKTFTKSFQSGVLVLEPLVLPDIAAEVECDRLFVPSDGKPGGGKRVIKHFPRIDTWGGSVRFEILDDKITEAVFRRVADNAGLLVGIGRARPERGGYFGRFEVTKMAWED